MKTLTLRRPSVEDPYDVLKREMLTLLSGATPENLRRPLVIDSFRAEALHLTGVYGFLASVVGSPPPAQILVRRLGGPASPGLSILALGEFSVRRIVPGVAGPTCRDGKALKRAVEAVLLDLDRKEGGPVQ